MFIEIGAFDAKSRLSKILQEVKKGKCFTITVRGEPIADLVPSGSAAKHDFKAAVADMQSMTKIRGVSNKTITKWIKEGRK